MQIRGKEVTIPTSMVGNYPNPRWWDAHVVREWTGDQEPPDSFLREALEDAMASLATDQETAGLDIITDGRVHGDNYADQALYYYYKRLGYDLKGGFLGFPIYSRLHAGTLTQEVKRHGAIMVEQARALKAGHQQADQDPVHGDPGTWSGHQRPPLRRSLRSRHGNRGSDQRGHSGSGRHGHRLHPVG